MDRRKASLDSLSVSSCQEQSSLSAVNQIDLQEPQSSISTEDLQRENANLKRQLQELRTQYQQLLEEGKEETFTERRVHLLKAQVMQLERQVVLLSEGLSSQICRCRDVERALDPLMDRLRSLLCVEVSRDSPEAEVTIRRSELTQLVEKCEDAKQKLHRSNKVTTVENLSMPWLLTKSNMVKQPVTLLDFCYGKTNNLNLQQVSVLESRLSQLFKHLHEMRQTLSFILAPGTDPPTGTPGFLTLPAPPAAVYARLLNQANQCSKTLDCCCRDLLTLSLIVPSAPWAAAEQRICQELEAENILAVLPGFPRGAPHHRAKRAAEALSKAANYSQLMAGQQVEALEAELEFHRSLYNLQIRYTEELIQSIRQAYQTFQENIHQSLCVPLKDVFSYYESLRSTASEEALRNFLTVFKSNASRIQEAVDAMSPSKNEGDEALSRYGRDFLQSVESLLRECAEKRERAANQVQTLREEYDQALRTLRSLKIEKNEKLSTLSQRSSATEEADLKSPVTPSRDKPGGAPGSLRNRSLTKETSTTPTEHKHRTVEKTPTLDVNSETPKHNLTGITQNSTRKNSTRSPSKCQSTTAPPRPPWQS